MPSREFAGGAILTWDAGDVADDVIVGPDVRISCRRLTIEPGCSIGDASDVEAFRNPAGVRIDAEHLHLGAGTRIARGVLVRGGSIDLGARTRIGNRATISVSGSMTLAPGGTMHEDTEISGVRVVIGRRLWMLPGAKVGGGGSMEVHSDIEIGHWAHLGVRSLLNTARKITVGHEVGLGTGTCLYTHGAYASVLEGKPVAFGEISVGDRTWIPGAVVNPSVAIGSDCVIGVGSVVTRDIPSGALAAGAPAKVLRENAFPREVSGDERERIMTEFLRVFGEINEPTEPVEFEAPGRIRVGKTTVAYAPAFDAGAIEGPAILLTDHAPAEVAPDVTVLDLPARTIAGPATALTERVLNQLRRYGVRFNYDAAAGSYVAWPDR